MWHSHQRVATRSSGARIVGLLGAAVALATSLVHVPMLGEHSWVVSIVVAAMLIGCAHCSVCLFRNPTTSAWLRTAAMGAIMLAVHPVLMSLLHRSGGSDPHAGHAGHAGGAMGGMDMGAGATSSMQPWMSLMTVFATAEIVIALAALAGITAIALRRRTTAGDQNHTTIR